MRFGIVVPIYNVEDYLRECLDSIYQQDYDDYEVILVDDGSRDGSSVICDEYASVNKNTRVIHKKNQGLISARRTGYKVATAEYIVNCDSDDYIEPHTLMELSKIIDKFGADLIIYNSNVVYDDRKEVFFEHTFEEGIIGDKNKVYDELLLSHKINSLCMKVFRRNLIDIDNDYSEYYGNNFGEDLLQSIPIVMNAQKLYYLDRTLYNYRMKSGMTARYNNKQYWACRTIYDKIRTQLVDLEIEDFEEKLSKYLVASAYDAIHQNHVIGEYHEDDVLMIVNDPEYINAYSMIESKQYIRLFTVRQRIILKIIKYRFYRILRLLFVM